MEDFWGNYSDRQDKKKAEELLKKEEKQQEKKQQTTHRAPTKPKLSYMEQRERDQLEKDLEKLEKRKDEINKLFTQDNIPYDEVTKLSNELGEIMRHIETKEMRRLELSERK